MISERDTRGTWGTREARGVRVRDVGAREGERERERGKMLPVSEMSHSKF